ncbi:hypothetical protein DB88DRAFT_489644 [Papiliotrema laurentii]|uniref:Peroxin domain-containing protein n=1 Tax=Papiliotrema laurentii TaxID=5418 RepID=A0AAD9FP75_PAPLA|nr:hypothetical protein DB88DRAFT_489644 [Papiliotrema laurentii]
MTSPSAEMPGTSPIEADLDTAGPSRRRLSSSLSPPDQHELERISSSLANREKRRSSISPVSKRNRAKGAAATRIAALPHSLGLGGDSDEEADYEGLDEDEVGRLEQEKYAKKKAAALKELEERPPAISVECRTEEGVSEEGGEPGTKQEYVWDVLFENQRGLYILGRAYFSSRSLLPADPSAYTLPAHSLPSASSFTVAQPRANGGITSQTEERVDAKRSRKEETGRRKIKTAYTLDTFQTPSPSWIWITPWMANMRVGTDEAGWRYNYWFKSKGWKSHAGLAGWGGWVRRREWVRLRCLSTEEVLPAPKDPEDQVDVDESLGKVIREAQVEGLVKALSKSPLDRQRMDTWEKWLQDAGREDKDMLKSMLEEEEALHELSRSFTYRSTFTSLLELLERDGILSGPSPSGDSPKASSPEPYHVDPSP